MEREEVQYDKRCGVCMYLKDEDYCIRKKQKVVDDDTCLHCVKISERRSLEKLIEKMVDMFAKEDE